MYKNKIKTVVMEVSAHAIHYQKTAGINWAGVIFTNITQDHLDFFNSFTEYKDTKVSFFRSEKIKFLAVNVDDEYGKEVLENAQKNTEICTFCCKNGTFLRENGIFLREKCTNLTAFDITMTGNGTVFKVNYPKKTQIYIPICGKFNVYNTLAAVAVAVKFGVKWSKIVQALAVLPQVAGRFNTYTANGITIIVDYAHTPDGLKKILTAARELSNRGELICIFGCGGDRDRTKRGIMGQISVELADRTVITSDNPRTEDPNEIIAEIERGIITRNISAVVDSILEITPQKYVKITDRAEAIEYALSQAKAGDIVVIAGKGHENYMDINGIKVPYSDTAAVKNWIDTHTIKWGT
jgi:UDP-N-acetylmuramyl-tripeptide synthetase